VVNTWYGDKKGRKKKNINKGQEKFEERRLEGSTVMGYDKRV
jgi:hypothetical protein